MWNLIDGRRKAMRKSWKGIMAAALAILMGSAAWAKQSGERIRIRPAEVPKELVDLVKKFHPTGTIGEADRRERTDRVEYRLDLVLRDRIGRAEFDIRPDAPIEGKIEDRPWAGEIPEAVREALKKVAADADAGRSEHQVDFDADDPGGRAEYKWSLKEPRRRITISADGASVLLVERIPNDAIPPAVGAALTRDFKGIRIRDIDRITRNGEVTYDIDVKGGDDLIATAEGKISVKGQ